MEAPGPALGHRHQPLHCGAVHRAAAGLDLNRRYTNGEHMEQQKRTHFAGKRLYGLACYPTDSRGPGVFSITHDPREVTCQRCLLRMKKQGVL